MEETKKFDLTAMPVLIQVYPADQVDCIEAAYATKAEIDKLVPLSARQTVEHVMEHYRKSSVANSIHADLTDILKVDVSLKVYEHTLGIDRDSSEQVIADNTQQKINDEKFFREAYDEDQNPYWLSEIRVYKAKDHDLGGLEKGLYH